MKTRIYLALLGLFCVLNSYSQHEQLVLRTNQIYDSLVQIRRDLHCYPELAGNEIRTALTIEKYLLSLGLEVKTGVGGHGVVGILRGRSPGKTIAWRADIDALKTDFPDGVDFKSKNRGVRHICGHDVHTAIGLGIANVLSTIKTEFEGTIMFIFQPAEENCKGAVSMIESGIFDTIKPDAIFALHVAPLPSDKIACKTHEFYWRGKVLSIEIDGPENFEDVTKDFTAILLSASTESENSVYFEAKTLLTPQNNPGNPNSIFKDYFVISGRNINYEKTEPGIVIKAEVESSNKENLITGLKKIKHLSELSEYNSRIKNIAYTESYPTVYNNPDLTDSSVEILTNNFGKEIFTPLFGVSPFSGDDFAYFQEKIDGVYFFLGASDFEKDIMSLPHSPNFNVDEEAIKNGVKYFSTLMIDQLIEMNKNAP